MSNLFENNGASFSKCRKYRYALWRIWDKSKPMCAFIGLNPSKADEKANDRTMTRVIGFATKWGYGGVYMLNLYPMITPYPRDLEWVNSNENDTIIETACGLCEKVILAWGANKKAQERGKKVAAMFPDADALQINKNGSPKHPLYVKGDIVPVKYSTTNH